ncbi:NADH-quinone oxidoreductase subunit N [Paenibacillus thermoaerophilus]|uniref:NADH-quinone oxidoreductase subunit N n=1 Tax=Paenibacillus thermoaerophilus TaxID=1215385 RepID=A0ABW2VA46_9BACL|nr:NADH-quinone oxidoreductase subunit N [Paenibacillus thermoaerophilus]TMV12495.1 NADH-quinone oxidoreductase subunit N [Paenibacillus thermoaerophilus]
MNALQAGDLIHLLPELILVGAAVFLTLLDLALPRRFGRSALAWLTLAAIAGSAAAVAMKLGDEPVRLLNDSYRIEDYANLFKLVFLGGGALVVLMSIGSIRDDEIPHKGEYFYLFLPALVGAMVVASSGDLITLFVGLELLGISSYVLVGMRKGSGTNNEAAFKYVVTGAIASAILLYGFSFLYGMSGSTNLGAIRNALIQNYEQYDAMIYLSFFLVLAGFALKVAAAPFHAWAPDVYEGAPTPITAFLAVVSKLAAFAILFRVIYNVYALNSHLYKDVLLALAVLAAAAMILGNALALKQYKVKRLLAFSGIANAGYLFVPLAANFSLTHYNNFSELLYYGIAYAVMNIGALAVLMAVSNRGENEELSAFAGLYHRAPWTAAAMTILLVSLAGLPVTGGFFGKLFILLGAMQTELYWLGAVMIVTSVVSFYYYFGFIRQMYMRSSGSTPLSLTGPLAVAIWICTVLTLALGFAPHIVIGYMTDLFQLQSDFLIG